MKRRRSGIYLDTEGVALALTEGKELVSSTFLPFSLSDSEPLSEKTEPEIEPPLRKGLQELNVDLKEACVGLADRDTIFRFLELPLMRRREIQLALPLEIEKYIPFKIEDIVWDYKEKYISREKKIKIAFLAMKKEPLRDILNIFKNINLEINFIAGGSFSALGALIYLGKISKKNKNYAVFSISEKDGEINIFSDNFPYFSRYTRLSTDSQGKLDVVKIIEELRLTIDYYRRESNSKTLEKVFLLGRMENLDLFSPVLEELEIPIEKIPLKEILKHKKTPTLQEVKAFSLTLTEFYPSVLRFNLLKEKKEQLEDRVPGQPSSVAMAEEAPLNLKGVIYLSILSLFLFSAILLWGIKKEIPKIKELKRVEKELEAMKVSLSLNELKAKNEKLSSIYQQARDASAIPKDINLYIKLLSKSISEGMWLEIVNFRRSADLQRLNLAIVGYIYLDDSGHERESLNEFVSNLKNSDLMKKKKSDINLNSIVKAERRGYPLTRFEMEIKE